MIANDIHLTLYVEPFGGPDTEFFRRHPSKVEAYNDYDGNLVNLFRVLQDLKLNERFTASLSRTLYSPEECRRAREILAGESDEVERAWALFVLQNAFMATYFKFEGKWGRSFDSSGARNPRRTDRLSVWHDRISRALIDNRAPLTFIRYWDSEETLMYVDPPEGYSDLSLMTSELLHLMGAVVCSHYVKGFIPIEGKYFNEKAAALVDNRKLA